MKVDQIIRLLDAGYSKDQIEAMENDVEQDQAPETPDQSADETEQDQAPESPEQDPVPETPKNDIPSVDFTKLESKMDQILKAIQFNNRNTSSGDSSADRAAHNMEVMKSIFSD